MVKQSGLIAVGFALGLSVNGCTAVAKPPKFVTQIVLGSAFHPVSQAGEIDSAVHTLSGTPIAAATVQVLNADGSARATLNADATGQFHIELPPEKMQVMPQMPPYVAFREWDLLTFCNMLGHFWNQPVEEIYGGDLGWASFLKGQDNKFLTLDPNELYKMVIPNKWKSPQAAEI